MKKLFRIGFVALLAQIWAGFTPTWAQNKCFTKAPAADVEQLRFLVGQWQGQVTENGSSRALQLRFFEQDGQIMATAQDAGRLVPLTLQTSLCAPGKFHFFGVGSKGEDFRFNARLQDQGLSGSFTLGSSCGKQDKPAFVLRRAVAAN